MSSCYHKALLLMEGLHRFSRIQCGRRTSPASVPRAWESVEGVPKHPVIGYSPSLLTAGKLCIEARLLVCQDWASVPDLLEPGLWCSKGPDLRDPWGREQCASRAKGDKPVP